MRPKSSSAKKPAERMVKDIRPATQRHFSAEDKIRIVLEGLRGDDSVAELCHKEGIAQSRYYACSKEFTGGRPRTADRPVLRAAITSATTRASEMGYRLSHPLMVSVILKQRERIKWLTIEHRRMLHPQARRIISPPDEADTQLFPPRVAPNALMTDCRKLLWGLRLMRLLLAEDDEALATTLIDHFGQRGFALDCAETLKDASLMMATSQYAALILDRGLPDGDGTELLQSLRAQGHTLPVIILTARAEIDSRIAGLDAGADDYLTKPFSPDELVARLRAVLRRNVAYQGREIVCANLALDTDNLVLRVEGEVVVLSQREAELLGLLLRRIGLVVTKRLAEDQLFGCGEPVGSNAIEVYIHRLWQKLEAAGSRAEILTLRGVGYVLRSMP